MRIFKEPIRFNTFAALHLLLLVSFTSPFQAQSEPPGNLPRFLEKRLLNEICPVETNAVARRVFKEYGAVFAADASVRIPNKCIYSNESEVQEFQKQLAIKNAIIRGIYIELQKPAMESLLQAIAEVSAKGLTITPLDGSIAARRSYFDTARLWSSRFLPALYYWVSEDKISQEESAAARSARIQKQVEMVIDWESKGMYFSTNFSKSIFSSVAPPGTSQHISLLAFDVAEHANPDIRDVLNKHGWFQTIASDATHFTFVGVKEADLPARGLKLVESGGQRYWIPNTVPGTCKTPRVIKDEIVSNIECIALTNVRGSAV